MSFRLMLKVVVFLFLETKETEEDPEEDEEVKRVNIDSVVIAR